MHPSGTPTAMLSMSIWQAWLDSPPGQHMLAWEQAEFDQCVTDLFGFHAFQMGLVQLDALRANRIPFRGVLADWRHAWACGQGSQAWDCNPVAMSTDPPAPAMNRPQVVARFEELPLQTASVDLMVMPHTLELAEDQHQVLREVERVLIPEGRVLLTGFNPWSLWGLRRTTAASKEAGKEAAKDQAKDAAKDDWLPGQLPLLSSSRLKDWLLLLGLEPEFFHYGCHGLPSHSPTWLDRSARLEQMGERWWPRAGGVYCVQAVKRRRSMRMVGPPWRDKRVGKVSVVAPSALGAIEPNSGSRSARSHQDLQKI